MPIKTMNFDMLRKQGMV